MKDATFARDWTFRRDPVTRVDYVKDTTYSLSEEAFAAAEAAGVLKEDTDGRSGRSAGKSGSDTPKG